jgi:hypothetical protein
MSQLQIPKQKYEILPSLKPFHESDAPARLLVGPFRSGKSVAAVMELYWMKLRGLEVGINKFRTVCVRKTYRMLKDSVIKTFFEWIPKEAGKYSEADLQFSMPMANGGFWEVLFRSADTPDDIDKFRGVEITDYWIDEAQEVAQDVKLILDGRRSFPAGAPVGIFQSLLTTNPCDTSHFIYRDWVENPLPGHKYWRQGARENKFLHKEYYDELERIYRDRPEIKRRYVDGEWGAIFSGKPVYIQEFNYDHHVSKEHLNPIDGVPIVRGWDFGLSPACVFTQLNPNGQWMILRELCGEDTSVDEFGDIVRDFSGRNFRGFSFEDVGDPAGTGRSQTDEKSCMDILRTKGIFCRSALTNEFLSRREAVTKRLVRAPKGMPLLKIDPRCKKLIDGFSGGYRYKESGNTGLFSERPLKNEYSHPHDALQYAAMHLFGIADWNPKLWAEPLRVRGIVGA